MILHSGNSRNYFGTSKYWEEEAVPEPNRTTLLGFFALPHSSCATDFNTAIEAFFAKFWSNSYRWDWLFLLNRVPAPQMPPTFSARATPISPSSDQFTTSDFWLNPEPSAASSGSSNGHCHDFPATKRRKLSGKHSLAPYEACPPQQEELSGSQQTYFSPQYSHLSRPNTTEVCYGMVSREP